MNKNTSIIRIGLTFATSRSRVLDFDAGFGILLSILSSLYVSVFAMDIAREQFDTVAKILVSTPLPTVRLVPPQQLNKFQDKSECSYDAVVIDNILEHVPSPEQMILYFSRIFKFDGIVVLPLPTGYLNCRTLEISSDGHLIRTEVSVHNVYSFFWMCTYKLIYIGG